jgi:hypothetical protein
VAKLTREERDKIAETRLLRIVGNHTIATARTLEQKISDAGPFNQRINPHVLTRVRNQLVADTKLIRWHDPSGTPWYYLPDAQDPQLSERFQAQHAVHSAFSGERSVRIGQALEIAVYRALCSIDEAEFFGRFKDLDAHDDSTLYSKEEPPRHLGKRSLPGDVSLDFILRDPEAGYIGVECKNVRTWLYPDRDEVTETLQKCLALRCLPVIIGRRVPYVSYMLLSKCGVLFHQNYTQFFPVSEKEIADQARDKTLLGYHDIRVGNEPDERLRYFLETTVPKIVPGYRARFDEYADLLEAFAGGTMAYHEFAARVVRRDRGENEDGEIIGDPADWE